MRACHFCGSKLPVNDELEHFQHGTAVAFDAGRGRLWAICSRCGRWSLAPLETRWEALEELERLSVDSARALTSTDNITLLQHRDLRIVRVGRSLQREESWWRYGRTLLERNTNAQRAERRGRMFDMLIMMAVTGIPLPSWRRRGAHVLKQREREFGKTAWAGTLSCIRCGARRSGIGFDEAGSLRLQRDSEVGLGLHLFCTRCGRGHDDAGYALTGAPADHLLRRVLAYGNFRGAEQAQVDLATTLIDEAGSAGALTRKVAEARTFLGELPVTQALALEISASAERERRLLALEAAELAARWEEEERVAAIVDRELT